ncbi:hypothetical protein JOC69_000925 [Heliobacterium gestii]|nr:hypothetical protein [Heliomicrobium gestii]
MCRRRRRRRVRVINLRPGQVAVVRCRRCND